MKKIFTLMLIAAGMFSFNAASAQYRNDRYGNQNSYPVNQSNGQWNNNGHQQNKDYGYDNNRRRNRDYNRQEEYRRQQEYDRMNQQCDEQIQVYRNDRSLNRYERDRRIQQVEYERQQKSKVFGKGLVVGGIAAIVIGAIFAHGN